MSRKGKRMKIVLMNKICCDKMSRRNYELKPLKIPDDDENFLKRGFFAYGIFKEGQLAHSKIKEYVDHIESGKANREMHLRDGVPFITNQENRNLTTKGQKIFFIEGKEKKAYEKICNTEAKQLYEWGIIEIDEKEYNVLFGKDPRKGSSYHVDDNEQYLDSFDGKIDPYFSEIFPFIRNGLNELFDQEKKVKENELLFKLQMYYMLLWSAIDRFCSVKYDVSNKQGDYLKALSKDYLFINALDNTHIRGGRPIFSAKNLSFFKLDKTNPWFCVNYYYTIRSNVVHRGKDKKVKIGELHSSLVELLEIFEKMINETFK